MKRLAAVLAVAALIAPARAAAHTTLIRMTPANGAVLDQSPHAVHVEFDDGVHVAGGNAAVSNTTGSSVLDGKATAAGHILSIPLRARLDDGAYSVRWSVVSDDGHREQGVLAFAVGNGSGTPQSVLGASATLTWNDVLLRTLYFFGLLAAAGATVFWLLNRRALGDRLRAPIGQLIFFALLAAFIGGSGIVHSAPPGTRYALVMKVAITIALIGGAAAALAPSIPLLIFVAGGCSLALLVAPPLAGHALDRDQPRVLAALVDVAHIASAAVWIGGLLALVYALPRASDEGPARSAGVRRFSTSALVAVAVLGLSGLGRSLTELSSVHQIWTTSYGQTLIVKSALFAPLLALGWLNRSLLLGAFSRLRRSALVEVTLLLAIVVAVGVLTELRPGVATRKATAATQTAIAAPAVLPPHNAIVAGRELGSLALAVARTPGFASVSLLAQDGTGVDGRRVTVNGETATSCGAGCYRAPAASGPLTVRIGERVAVFDLPDRAADASALLDRVTRRYRSSHTMIFLERLASSPTAVSETRFEIVAPHRLSYQTTGGPGGIVIGNRRWDRDRIGARWLESSQTPLNVTSPYWQQATNVHLVAPNVLTLLDRSIPAWFRVTLAKGLPVRVEMTAPAHFMVDRYVGFDVPVEISPPPSR